MKLKEQVLAGMIRSRLSEDKRTSGQSIDVYVADGDIFLLGTVDDEMQRETAEVIVRGIVGVREVVDRIRVRQHMSV
jgi:osmotically-inducible protein OsmY